MIYITNAFSINMLAGAGMTIRFAPMSVSDVIRVLYSRDFTCAIGHADTARLVGDALGYTLEANRVNIVLDRNTGMIVAQYTGPRLPEGTTTLPEGAKIDFWMVEPVWVEE